MSADPFDLEYSLCGIVDHLWSRNVCRRCGAIKEAQKIKSTGKTQTDLRSDKHITRFKVRSKKLEIIRQIYIRDGRGCAYCGIVLMPLDQVEAQIHVKLPQDYPTLDHVVPVAKGGRTVLANLVVACHTCNVRKGDAEGWRKAQPRTPADSRCCSRCNGEGETAKGQQKVICDWCRGAGVMSIDRYAEVLEATDRNLATLRRHKRRQTAELKRLREIVESQLGNPRAWAERAQLVASVNTLRNTIRGMQQRIEELRS